MTRPGRPAKVGLFTRQGLVCDGSERAVVRQSASKRFNRLAGSLRSNEVENVASV